MTRTAVAAAARPVATAAALLSGAVLAFGAVAGPAAADEDDDGFDGFDDTRGTAYADAVDALAERGITNGCTETDFCPTRALTRAETASLMARTFDLDTDGATHDFPDVGDTVHAGAIAAVAEEGLMNGRGSGEFAPREETSRAEASTILTRAFNFSAPDDAPFFYDVGGGVHAEGIAAVVDMGVSNGCAPGLFCPDESLTRGQFALFLGRTLGYSERVDLPDTPDEDPREPDEPEETEVEGASGGDAPWEGDWTPRHGWDVWESLAACESDVDGTGPDWSINTGNGFYGGLQFALSSWRAVGGEGYPHHASREEQIYRGERLQAVQGWGAWPACSSKIGLR